MNILKMLGGYFVPTNNSYKSFKYKASHKSYKHRKTRSRGRGKGRNGTKRSIKLYNSYAREG